MTLSWRRVMLGTLAGVYLVSLGAFAAVVGDRIRADRARMAVVRAAAERQKEARAQAIRAERSLEAEHRPR